MKKGFTLAEVLITLVIIGVIAALTIPNLIQKYTEQTTVKKLQKFYSTLSNAYNLAMKDNGPANEWGLIADTASANKIYDLLFKPYFKITKNCGTDNTGNCITNNNYKYLDNTEYASYGGNNGFYKVTLDDGAAVFWRGYTLYSASIAILYDVNGQKGPNMWGRDLFDFLVKKDKVFPTGIPSGEYSAASFNNECKLTGRGGSCAAWVIYKGNMDYLHCDGLTWKSHSCKEK